MCAGFRGAGGGGGFLAIDAASSVGGGDGMTGGAAQGFAET